ncbi:type ISP restriction/modification enzyme [Brachyspira sp.]|uniref:type ISP restriction/modification enzyme n=1 Tax=Brachyspira sp. TaxID=1977261 RepID=UPI003D7EF5BB
MSTHQIEEYYNKIEDAKKSGMNNEQNIREFFYELLKNYTNPLNIKIEREPIEHVGDKNIYYDGRLKKGNMDLGWVENKDEKDDLEKEIKNKIDKNYNLNNTIFENSKELVLYQNGKRIIKIKMSDGDKLDKVLTNFVNFKIGEYKKFQDAFDNLKRILPELAEDLRGFFAKEKRINKEFEKNLKDFKKMCKRSIDNNITEEIAIEMIIQHMLTRDIFVMLFHNQNFHRNNIISKSIEDILENINQKSAEISQKIESYMQVLNSYIANMDKKDKQDILKTFYSDFYKALNSKKADVQGIEYTPIEIVKFMVDASEELLYRHFDKKLSSKDVNILDPCSGTGIFMAEIINRINKNNLKEKYKNELFSNEIDIMPYYISNLNIENAYFERTNNYEIFENMCFLDTLEFQIKSEKTSFFGMEEFNKENVERAVRQYKKKINLIIGNPPYNANQKSENDNNKNKVYVDLDKRIKETYINESKAQKTKQYDMYKRFIRWATDRIKSEDDGIIAFITNNAYLDSRQDDGFRKSVQKEFDYIYIVDLKGNARKRNKIEGGNVFNIQTGVAIMFLIKKGNNAQRVNAQGVKTPCYQGSRDAKNNNKVASASASLREATCVQLQNENPLYKKKADIKYYNIGDYLSGDKKLMALQHNGKPKKITEFNFEDIIPDKNGQWLNQTDNDFYEHIALIDKNVKNQKVGKAIEQKAIFKLFTLGVSTNRDDWAYDFDKEQLTKKIKYFLKVYDNERKKWADKKLNDEDMNDNLDYSIKWSEHLKNQLISNKDIKFNKKSIVKCLYRPFAYQYLYFNNQLCDRLSFNKFLFPNENSENICLTFTTKDSYKFDILATNKLSDLHATLSSINAPLYIYENGEKKINITDYALKEFKKKYKESATHENIFAYCHAVLSSPKYQKKYEENLKTDYPRIPFYSKNVFDRFVELGKRLIKLQTEFDNTDCHNEIITSSLRGDSRSNLNKVDCHASIEARNDDTEMARNDDTEMARNDNVKKVCNDEINLKIEKDLDYMPSGIENPNKNRFFDFLQIKKDKGIIIFDSKNRISNIPKKAFDYKIGTRSALDWIIDYYKPKKLNPDKETHHKTLIENDFTNYDYKKIREYLFDLIPRVIQISVEVVEIFEELESLDEGGIF